MGSDFRIQSVRTLIREKAQQRDTAVLIFFCSFSLFALNKSHDVINLSVVLIMWEKKSFCV